VSPLLPAPDMAQGVEEWAFEIPIRPGRTGERSGLSEILGFDVSRHHARRRMVDGPWNFLSAPQRTASQMRDWAILT
jgi:hypothetical protein